MYFLAPRISMKLSSIKLTSDKPGPVRSDRFSSRTQTSPVVKLPDDVCFRPSRATILKGLYGFHRLIAFPSVMRLSTENRRSHLMVANNPPKTGNTN